LQNNAVFAGVGLSGVSVGHVGIGIVVASVLAGSVAGAAAQTYYPPPAEEYYPVPPQPYERAPVPPGYIGAPPHVSYDSPYDPQADAEYPAPDDPYFTPAEHVGPPASPSVGWDQRPRPPAAVGSFGTPAGVTGSLRDPGAPGRSTVIAALPPEDQPEAGPAIDLPPQFHRQLVDYVTSEPAGTVIIDTPHTYLYLVRGGGKALRYGIGVGREGFTWAGSERVSRMSEWPDWHPPKEMIERQPYLPRFMAGGAGNPLGARALYLGNTLYRIHGTNQPSTIGHFVSSGCIRLTNDDIEDLYSRVNLGTRVVVLPGSQPISASAQGSAAR
jgi:lipoprotein-anchoring transpeptidase ErfK/SrfK